MSEENKTELVKKIAEELLKNLEIPATFTVEEKGESVEINLSSDNPGLLIGYHGETLAALQLILSLAIYRKTDVWQRILLDVGDYRQRRAEVLKKMALSMAQKVKFSGTSQALPPMSSFERRIIHLALSDNPDIQTVSEGEGNERRVIVKPRTIS